MNKEKYYITTPIYYINDVPHIGHAYTTIAADVLARFYLSRGYEVYYLTGVDEHGAKIAEAAKRAGKSPHEFVEELAPKFKDAWRALNINYSEFFRTTNKEHEKLVSQLVGELVKKGHVEKRQYEGLYCIGCERYLKPEELVDGMCSDHKKEPVLQAEENYFFKLSEFSSQLIDIIESGDLEIEPASRKKEILGKIKAGLEDVSISRAAVDWGIPFPDDPTQTIYVWIDALFNYYTATQIYNKEEIWPADLHLMAKDILWFHAIVWPAMLLALGLPTPKKVFAHGFFTIGKQKMSKSLGNVLDPIKLAEKYGADALRYSLLREFPFGEDGDISEEKIAMRYEKDLGNELGNLLQRTISMINKYGVQPQKSESYFLKDEEAAELLPDTKLIYDIYLPSLQFDQVLIEIWKAIRGANVYIDEKKPWELAKEPSKVELGRVLNVVYFQIQQIVELLIPFMPDTSEKIQEQLESLEPKPLFPRFEQ